MRTSVVGGGAVGVATARAFCTDRVHDIDRLRSVCSLDEALSADLVFVCLPETAVPEWFREHGQRAYFALRSTVPIGTTPDYAAHWPDFHTPRLRDELLPDRLLVGGADCEAGRMLCSLLERRWPMVPLQIVPRRASEAAKLTQNALNATTVAFFNELRALCSASGAPFLDVRAALRMPPVPAVPGPDGRPGFGGRCLPKDLRQYILEHTERGLAPHVAAAAERRNADDRR